MSTPEPPPPLPPAKSACAACKHQRRRCAADCPLAPYFSADRQSDFANVHRLFGIKKVSKLLQSVAPRHRDDAAKSIVYEANLRAMHPVAGCFGAAAELRRQIQICEAELEIVSQNLAFLKQNNSFVVNNQETDFQIEENSNLQRFFNDLKPALADQ
ncbi:LOB domain-containing protein 22-like [Salvia miltiorrhiza]|uniref:LOB domain-containing protein 22-like n=1 Tax=Salvia miltiorrhiza TaxID=226208 RepID=UPI0025ACD7D1|nr:LOB domain-containing protein 22-like [Salvia miltiorrhiza]XP_057799865.1 LOB domain-containing protein 22-like [Salvia miltiorrhiza]XP_057799866.1 LOB domain-containing protein 22-like [Salvia miltiorrhiza]